MRDYEIGQVIELVEMLDDPNPIPAGTRGTIRAITVGFKPHERVISVDWEIPRTLTVITPPDRIRVVAST